MEEVEDVSSRHGMIKEINEHVKEIVPIKKYSSLFLFSSFFLNITTKAFWEKLANGAIIIWPFMLSVYPGGNRLTIIFKKIMMVIHFTCKLFITKLNLSCKRVIII